MTRGIIIIIDGCNENYISSATTPFVQWVKQKGSYTNLSVTPAFSHRSEIFTGMDSYTTDLFVTFCFSSQRGKYNLLQNLPLREEWHTGSPDIAWLFNTIDWIRSGVWSCSKSELSLLTLIYYIFTNSWIDFGRIPYKLLPYLYINPSIYKYDRKEKNRSRDHLFGLLQLFGFDVEFLYGDTDTINRRAIRPAKSKAAVRIIHYGETDKIGHKFGPNSSQIRETLKVVDRSIQRIYEAYEKDIDFIMLISDHDMTEVKKHLDLLLLLRSLRSKFIEDYLVFANASLARFWFRTADAEAEIGQFLEGLGEYGRVIDASELADRGVPTHEKYGHLIFWMRPGVIIWPNFYHSYPVKGMHTYFDQESTAPMLLYSRSSDIELTIGGCLTDVTPTILDFMRIPIPRMDGKSLLIRK